MFKMLITNIHQITSGAVTTGGVRERGVEKIRYSGEKDIGNDRVEWTGETQERQRHGARTRPWSQNNPLTDRRSTDEHRADRRRRSTYFDMASAIRYRKKGAN